MPHDKRYVIISAIKEIDNMQTTGEALKHFRKRACLTQKQVVNKINKSQQWMSDVENNKVSLSWDDIKLLCKLYGVTVDDLQNKEE